MHAQGFMERGRVGMAKAGWVRADEKGKRTLHGLLKENKRRTPFTGGITAEEVKGSRFKEKKALKGDEVEALTLSGRMG